VTHSVVIIGAGFAGLAAARGLADRGFTPIVVEARDRIGGRVWTSRLGDKPIDLGACWIHGNRGNPLTKLAQQAGATLQATDWDKIWFPGVSADTAQSALARTEWLYSQRGRGSVADVIPRSWHKNSLMSWAVQVAIQAEYGADPADLALASWRDDEDFGGGDFLVASGYGGLLAHLARGLDVRLGHVVTAISEHDGGVTIETTKGRAEAEYAIVTLPLGVLKTGSVAFNPPLPESKQRAIQRLGVGVFNKLFLLFDQAFWPRDTQVVGHLGPYSIFIVRERTLFGLVGGEAARRAVPEAQEEILRALGAPPPIAWIATQWHLDPFALGAISVVPPGGTSADFDALRRRAGRLLFAGEATSRVYRGTVHGAYVSGQQAGLELEAVITQSTLRGS
jgi:polyamine oxidase